MGIEKEIKTKSGAPAKYWTLDSAVFLKQTGTWELTMVGYYTLDDYISGASPIYPPVKVSGPMNAEFYKLIYGMTKLPVEGNPFIGGIDIVDDPWRNPPQSDIVEVSASAEEGEENGKDQD